jgi:hypothetical protein
VDEMRTGKRIFAAIMALVIMASVLVGCTSDERGFLTIYKKMANLDCYEADFEMNLSMIGMNLGNSYKDKELQGFINAIGKYDLVGTSKVDSQNSTGDISISVKNNESKTVSSPLHMMYDTQNIYIESATLMDAIKFITDNEASLKLSSDEVKKFNRIKKEMTSNSKYIKIGISDYAAESFRGIPSTSLNEFGGGETKKAKSLMFRFIEGAQEQVLGSYTSNLFSKSGSEYVFDMNTSNAPEMIVDLISYLYDNADSFEKYVMSFLDSMTPSEYQLFGLSEESDIAAMKSSVGDSFATLKDGKDSFAESKSSLLDTLKTGAESIKGSGYKLMLNEVSEGVFRESQKLEFAMNAGDRYMNLSFASTATINSIDKLTIIIPENALDYKRVVDSTSKKIKISPKTGKYVFEYNGKTSKGTLKLIKTKSGVYVPGSKIAKLFGGNDSSKIRKYMKPASLKKYGYSVSQPSQKSSIIISKSSFEYLDGATF